MLSAEQLRPRKTTVHTMGSQQRVSIPGDTKLVAVEARAHPRSPGSRCRLPALRCTAAGEDIAPPYQHHFFAPRSVFGLLYFSREYQFCLQVSPASLLCRFLLILQISSSPGSFFSPPRLGQFPAHSPFILSQQLVFIHNTCYS